MNGPQVSSVIDGAQDNWQQTWLHNAFINGKREPAIAPIGELTPDDRESVVICGSGPSLMKDLSRLVKDPSVIIANHSNLATLLYFDIIPDYVMIADANEVIYERLVPVFRSFKTASFPTFILPTHIPPRIVDLLEENNCSMFFYPNIARKPVQSASADFYNFVLQMLTPSLEVKDADGKSVSECIVQCGCVSNASILFVMYLITKKAQAISEVYFSGVDFSFPDDKARCATITYSAENQELMLNTEPEFDPTPLRFKLNGLLTDDNQFAYYKDLRFIVSVMRQDFPDVKLFTTTKNFISDFLDVKAL